jgi:uncharacterized protein YkwD
MDIKTRVNSGLWNDNDRPNGRFNGEYVTITESCTVYVALYGTTTPIATFAVVIEGDDYDVQDPGGDTPDPNAPGVIIAHVGGADIGRVAYNGTTNISVPAAGTYQIKTSDSKDIKVRVGAGSFTDRDQPSRYAGEQVTITGATTVSVQLFGSTNIVATFNITIGGSSQPDNPDTPTPDPNAPGVIIAHVGGADIGRVAYNGTTNISVPAAGTYQIKTSDSKDIKVRVGAGSFTDRDQPSRYAGEQVTITGATTVSVQLFGSTNIVATFNITIGGSSQPDNPDTPTPDPEPDPNSPTITIKHNNTGFDVDSSSGSAVTDVILPEAGNYWIMSSNNRDIKVRFDNGSWVDRDSYSTVWNIPVSEYTTISRAGTLYVAYVGSDTIIATFRITIRSSSTVTPNPSSRKINLFDSDGVLLASVRNGGATSLTIPDSGDYYIMTNFSEDIETRFGSGITMDKNNAYGAYFGDFITVTSSGTYYVVLKNAETVTIATFRITLTNPYTPPPAPSGNLAKATEMLVYINQLRAQVGVPALQLSYELNTAADIRASEIYTYFSHTRPDGRDCDTVLDDINSSFPSMGENIAAGNASVYDTYVQWYNSPGHYANMVYPSYRYIGIGYYYNPAGVYDHYWAQAFAR